MSENCYRCGKRPARLCVECDDATEQVVAAAAKETERAERAEAELEATATDLCSLQRLTVQLLRALREDDAAAVDRLATRAEAALR